MNGVYTPMPTRYPGLIALIEEYHWTWRDINEAPADLIDELLTRIHALRKWQGERDKREQAKREQAKQRANAAKNKTSRKR